LVDQPFHQIIHRINTLPVLLFSIRPQSPAQQMA
jgi:hypothetical protein